MAERKIEDLNLTPDQIHAIEHARRTTIVQQQLDEHAAQILAESNSKLPPRPGFWRQVWIWITEMFS